MREVMTRLLTALIVVLLLLSGRAGAQQPNSVAVNRPASVAATVGQGEAEHVAPMERNPRYKICRDDVLSISFPLSPELNQKLMVQPDGFISLQNAGEVHVEGLTVPEAIEVIKKVYRKILHEPIVNVDLTDFQKPFFTVFGQVGKPGQYDLRNDLTVSQAIAVAGGFGPMAKTQIFLYRAVSSNWAEVRELKLNDILHGKNISEDVHLRPGDMIFVPEKAISHFRKYVPYSIGLTPNVPGMRL